MSFNLMFFLERARKDKKCKQMDQRRHLVGYHDLNPHEVPQVVVTYFLYGDLIIVHELRSRAREP